MSDETRLRQLATSVAMMAPEPVDLARRPASRRSPWMAPVVVAALVAALLVPALFVFQGGGEVLAPASLGTLAPVESGDIFQVVVPGTDLPSVWRLDVIDGGGVDTSWGLFASGPIAWAPWSEVDLDALEPELRASPDQLELPDAVPFGVHRLCLPESDSACFDLPVVASIERLEVAGGQVAVPDVGPVTLWSLRRTGVVLAEDVELTDGTIDVSALIGGTYFACRLESHVCWQFDVAPTEPAALDPTTAEWTAVPDGPLSPRAWAVGVWTGREVLVFGGEPKALCPPNADEGSTAECTAPGFAPLTDGAAFDPATESWRAIASAPIPIESIHSAAVVVEGDAYVLVAESPERPGAVAGFLRYRVADDQWDILDLPVSDGTWWRLAAGPGSVVVYPGSDESGEASDWLFDTTVDDWVELSPDPLSPSFDRTMVESEGAMYLFAHDLVENPGSDVPSLVRAARYDPVSSSWTRLSDSEIIGGWSAWSAAGFVVFPDAGSADGGDVNNWGRSYPYGGVYDATSDVWLNVPDWPATVAGAVLGDSAVYVDTEGFVLDLADMSWTRVPDHPGPEAVGSLVVAAGSTMFTFGGEVWPTSGEVLGGGRMWTPTG